MLSGILAAMLAMVDSGQSLTFTSASTNEYVLEHWLYDSWAAYKAYASFLNWHRPRGRKLSWKMLNWKQRHTAMDWYDRMIRVGGVAREYWE